MAVRHRTGPTGLLLASLTIMMVLAAPAGFALDLETGTIVPLEEVVGIDTSDVDVADKRLIVAPARVSPDGSALVLGINHPGSPAILAIASTGASGAPVSIDAEPRFTYVQAVQRFGRAGNNTILVPTVEGPAVLLTLERAAEATSSR